MTDREAIEAELTEAQLTALGELCAALDVRRDQWREVPALAQVFETAAVARYSARLQRRPRVRVSRGFCDRLAAESLGLDYQTTRSRRRRWRLLSEQRGTES